MGANAGTCLGRGRLLPSPDNGPKPEPSCWLGLLPGTRCPQQGGQARAAPQLHGQRPGTRSRTCGAGELRQEAVASGERCNQPDQQRRLTRAKTSPPVVTHGDLPMLQAQASKLRATIKRRTATAGASGQADDVAAIISHYSTVLAEIEEQIGQLKDASSVEATQAPAAAAEPAPAVLASGQATGKEHVSFRCDSVSTVATVSTACSFSGEPQA